MEDEQLVISPANPIAKALWAAMRQGKLADPQSMDHFRYPDSMIQSEANAWDAIAAKARAKIMTELKTPKEAPAMGFEIQYGVEDEGSRDD